MRSLCATTDEGAKKGCGYTADTCDWPEVSGIKVGSFVPITNELDNGTGEPCLLSISSKVKGSLMTYRSCLLDMASIKVHVHTLTVNDSRRLV